MTNGRFRAAYRGSRRRALQAWLKRGRYAVARHARARGVRGRHARHAQAVRRPGRVGRDGQPIEGPQSTEFSSYLYPHAKTPASQTLSVLSLEHEAMVLPSGEKATEPTSPMCASCFSALSCSFLRRPRKAEKFREAATRRGGSVLGVRVQGYQCPRTRIPHFELLVGA